MKGKVVFDLSKEDGYSVCPIASRLCFRRGKYHKAGENIIEVVKLYFGIND